MTGSNVRGKFGVATSPGAAPQVLPAPGLNSRWATSVAALLIPGHRWLSVIAGCQLSSGSRHQCARVEDAQAHDLPFAGKEVIKH